MLGEDGTETWDLPLVPGYTLRHLLTDIESRMPRSDAQVEIGLNGKLCTDADLDAPLRDEDHAIVVPTTTAGLDILAILVYVAITAAVSVAINYAMQSLSPRPKAPGVPAERGDARSPTYSWDGISTSFGQGFPVPAVYGRHRVGGQVIYTDIFATTATGIVDDRLNIVLALSEGPIARIGDVDVVAQDGLGGVSGSTAGPPLPKFITVNDTELGTTNLAAPITQVILQPWTGNTPVFGVGDFLDVLVNGVYHARVQVLVLNNGTARTDLDVTIVDGPGVPFPSTLRDTSLNPAANAIVVIPFVLTRVNTTPGAIAYLRPGTMDQTALPSNPFRGTSVTFSPAIQLNEVNQESIFTYSASDLISTVGVVLSAPAGLYEQDNQGNIQAFPVIFNVNWRYPGTATWRAFYRPLTQGIVIDRITIGTVARTGPVVETFGLDPASVFQPQVRGPIEVRVQRLTPSGGTTSVSNVVWRNVFFNTNNVLQYPRVALLGLTLSSGARFNGGLPEMTVRLDGIKVRVWRESFGFSPRTWDAFTTGDWALSTQPPGRNPAWVLLDFLTSPWGLGKYVTDADLDLPAFRRWAAFCDADASPGNPWGNAGFQVDLVIDSPRPVWEWVLAICAAGRASPIYKSGKISVTYDYRDTHGDAKGLVVGALTPTQLITSGNCEKVQTTWLPVANRPTAFMFQFLNEEKQHRQDVFPVEDTESFINDPTAINREQWRPETIQAYGVTRPGQLFREGVYRHRINRLVRREIQFVTGRWALAAEVGDLIEFEHEMLRPFPNTPLNMMVVVGGVNVTEVTVDHIVAASGQIVVRDPNGAPQRALYPSRVIDGNNSILTLSTSVTCNPGATCVVGTASQLTEVYKIIGITLQRDLKREVRAVQWVPEIHDEVTPAMYAAGGDPLFDEEGDSVEQLVDVLADLRVVPMSGGTHRIAFARVASRKGLTARVYIRALSSQAWVMIGQTEGEFVTYDHFVAGVRYEVSLCFETFDGEATLPDAGFRTSFTASEFPANQPPHVTHVTSTDMTTGVLLQWDRLDFADFEDYEVRLGSDWNSAPVIYRGKDPSMSFTPPAGGAVTALVACRARSGLYGPSTTVSISAWVPPGTVSVLSEDDLAPSPAGTHSGTQWSSPVLELTATAYDGTYTGLEQDIGYQAPFFWSVHVDAQVLDGTTVDESDWELSGGEAMWRTVNGRQASVGVPGVGFTDTVDDIVTLVDDLPSTLLVHGNRGEAGAHARVLVESRFEVGGVWSSYKPHTNRVVAARKMQVRLSLNRETLGHQVQVTALRYAAHI